MKLDAANDRRPVCDPATLESNVPGIYLAGVIVAGERTNEIFIENGRFHGALIAEHLVNLALGKSTTNAISPQIEVRHIEAQPSQSGIIRSLANHPPQKSPDSQPAQQTQQEPQHGQDQPSGIWARRRQSEHAAPRSYTQSD